MRTRLRIALFAAFVTLLTACSDSNPLDIDVSDVNINLSFNELHDTLYQIPFEEMDDAVPQLAERYGEFLDFYSRQIINIGGTNHAEYANNLKDFQSYVIGNGIDVAVKKVFPNTSSLKEDVHTAFQHYKYHFPKRRIPEVYTYISGFQQSVVITNKYLGISLDKYLGADEPLYTRTGIERYKREKMYKEKVVSDCMQAIAISEFVYNDSVNNLLSQMVYHGKIMYFLDAMLPQTPDSIKIGYSARGIRWAKHNEKDVWDYLIAKKLLFSNDLMDIRKFTGEGPFTIPFTNSSPPHIGIWTGWQIVRSYMKNHPEVTVRQLMLDDDYQNILRYSRYHP